MHILGLLFPFLLMIVGAAIGGVIGGTPYAVWGGIVGLLIGGLGTLLAFRSIARARDNLPE
jgi:hypothetical protein